MVILAVLIWRARCLLSLCKMFSAFSVFYLLSVSGMGNKPLALGIQRRVLKLSRHHFEEGCTHSEGLEEQDFKMHFLPQENEQKPNSQCYGTVVIVPCATVPMYLISEQMLSAPIGLLVCNSVF